MKDVVALLSIRDIALGTLILPLIIFHVFFCTVSFAIFLMTLLLTPDGQEFIGYRKPHLSV